MLLELLTVLSLDTAIHEIKTSEQLVSTIDTIEYPATLIYNGDTLDCFTPEQSLKILQTFNLLDEYKRYTDSVEVLRNKEITEYKNILNDNAKEISNRDNIIKLKEAQLSICKKSYDRVMIDFKDSLKPKSNFWTPFKVGIPALLLGVIIGITIKE